MRSFLAGLTILVCASACFAQVRGEVESIGFGEGLYRPQCWTPMVVRLESQVSDPAEYGIEVHQRDLDYDHVIYSKTGLTLNGHATQRWEVCFLPEPIGGGLPENGLVELQSRLQVYLTNKDGTRQLMQLPITSTVSSLERSAPAKGVKLILYVVDGNSRPAFIDYQKAVGLSEDPAFVPVKPAQLPQDALAYQAVDVVLWISGDARILNEEGSKQLSALQQWVKQGGSLVICQPPSDGERQKIEPFAQMLPILWKENGDWKVSVRNRDDLKPLVDLAAWKNKSSDRPKTWQLKGPFPFASATARPDAVVDAWIPWDKDPKHDTPYIARAPYGLGCVTWVAQDLGNPKLTGPKTSGWPYVWDTVFGWKNGTRIPGDQTEADVKAYESRNFTGDTTDLAHSLDKGVEFGAKGAGLIVLAIFFFIGYWVIAGLGTFFFLAHRNRKELSWIAFGATALAATLLTLVVVRLVLRGSPEIHHATVVRIVTGQEPQPAIAYSRVGLYIPRDGAQRVSLPDISNQFVSYVTPLQATDVQEAEFPANLDYRVPVHEEGSAEPVAVDVPFRSTLKKLQVKWCGKENGQIRGNGLRVNPVGDSKKPITGTLDNLTAVDLKNVYIVFQYNQTQDLALYLPYWPATQGKNRIDLAAEFAKAQPLPMLGASSGGPDIGPDRNTSCRGDIVGQWAYYWWKHPGKDDLNAEVPSSFPELSLFDRIPPARNDDQAKTEAQTVRRRGGRNLDMSRAIAAGEVVVLAQSDARPLPFPLQVNGDSVGGEGIVFYQFALPLDHAGLYTASAGQ